MNIKELLGKKILIVGYGIEGKSVEIFLKQHIPTAIIGIADKRDGSAYLENQSAYDLAIRSPGVPPSLITIPYTTATNLFFSFVKNKTIGVTGTKGKSTTASLIYAILKEGGCSSQLIGNIGIPPLSVLDIASPDTIFVCELSSYQLEDIEYSPDISVVVSLYPEHMDHHGSAQLYWTAKKRIVAYAGRNDYYVYNPKFPELVTLAKETRAKAVPMIETLPFDRRDIPLLGKHNVDNVRLAVTVGLLLKIPIDIIKKAVQAFVPLPHRLERVGTYRGITFYDDALSTTPESTVAAIRALTHIDTIMLGGQDRGYNFTNLIKVIKAYRIPNIVLFPDSGGVIGALLKKNKVPCTIKTTSSMESAVAFAYRQSKTGSICLLSCASPSYSLWKNFEEKGNVFQHCVRLQGQLI